MLDTLQILLWSFAYVLIIFSGVKSKEIKKVAIPYSAGVPNLAWEICALQYSGGFWGHVLWLLLDIIIFIINFRFIRETKNKIFYMFSTVLLVFIFFISFKRPAGMLISVFFIDLTMAIFYIISFKNISRHYKIPVAVLKLFGDLFAGLENFYESNFVAVVTVIVFICNLVYLILCIREYVILGKDEYHNYIIVREKVTSHCGKNNKKKR